MAGRLNYSKNDNTNATKNLGRNVCIVGMNCVMTVAMFAQKNDAKNCETSSISDDDTGKTQNE
jgi:hypothetical protein